MSEDRAKLKEDTDPHYGPNPELYDRMAVPFDDRESADWQLKQFMLGVEKLRTEHRIAEVMLLCGAHFKPAPPSKESVSVRAVAFGHADFRAELGALAFNTYTLPDIEKGEQLRERAMAASPKKGRRR